MPTTVQVKLGDRSYLIRIGRNLSPGAPFESPAGLRCMMVSDSNVDPLHGGRMQHLLEERGIECFRAVVPAGETTKDLKWVAQLYERAAEAGLDRTGLILALGGGMIGDLAGFVAATYLRGVRFIQVPTSLLAVVDSSVGGKTGVNLSQGKNLVGAFYQPVEVVADLDLMATLPQREYVSGLAEVVKYGVIRDATFFGLLEKHAEELVRREAVLLERVAARCCEIKAEVVAMDEREIGPRAVLNFGHTLGHALEKVDGYGTWLHGEAVAIGLAYAARLSTARQGFPKPDADRVIALLARLGLPVAPPADREVTWSELSAAMAADKKTLRNKPRFVLASRMGAVLTGVEVEDGLLAEAWTHVLS